MSTFAYTRLHLRRASEEEHVSRAAKSPRGSLRRLRSLSSAGTRSATSCTAAPDKRTAPRLPAAPRAGAGGYLAAH